MAEQPDDKTLIEMESLLAIVSDYTRLKILYSIIDEEKNVSQIVAEVGASQSLVSHQLRVMRKANLVATRKEKTRVYYHLADDHISSLIELVHDHVVEK